MTLEIINEDLDFIESIESESNPFKVGEHINIEIKGGDTNFGKVKSSIKKYEVLDIEHYIKIIHAKRTSVIQTNLDELIKEQITVSITVKQL